MKDEHGFNEWSKLRHELGEFNKMMYDNPISFDIDSFDDLSKRMRKNLEKRNKKK